MKSVLKSLFLIFALLATFACTAQEEEEFRFSGEAVRILAIGNSFSMDAVEENLWWLAASDGHLCEIGNLYIGGCSLERHVNNARNDAPAYQYRKVVRGVHSTTNEVSLREALCDGKWDYISVQQVSQLSGIYDSYQKSLPKLLGYIRLYAPQAQIVLHETWAYAADSDHSGFANYDCDQEKMYSAIVAATTRAAHEYGISVIIHAGTAIQYARETTIGDNLTRDGYHLNALGRYTAACAWYETLFGEDVRSNGYFRNNLDRNLQRTVREAAHKAVAGTNADAE